MITDATQDRQVSAISRKIAEEAGYSSGRTYLSSILTKMAIVNNLIHSAVTQVEAIHKTPDHLWSLTEGAKVKIASIDFVRCSITGICANIAKYWPGANRAPDTVRKNLAWLESLGLFTLGDREKPILHKTKDKTQWLSPPRLFENFNLDLALEAYQALEQLLQDHLKTASPRNKPIALPDHGGALVKMLFTAVKGVKYRGFRRPPEALEDLPATEQSRILDILQLEFAEQEAARQVWEHTFLPVTQARDAIINEIEEIRRKTKDRIAAARRHLAFGLL